jgi:Tol biopolymer transport system component
MKAVRILVISIVVSIVSGALAQSSGATVPGQNGKIALTRTGDHRSDVFLVSPDGSSLERLAKRSYSPAFSPNGESVAYVDNFANDQLFVKDIFGRIPNQLTFDNGSCCYIGSPVFSPDGGSVIFDSADGVTPGSDLEEVSVAGGPPTLIASKSDALSEPTVSANGERIAIVHTYPQDVCEEGCLNYAPTQIYLLNLPMNQQKLVDTSDLVQPRSPNFAPFGSRIAFSALKNRDSTDRQIYSVKTDGTGLRQLTEGGSAANPVYSPDGRFIAFNRTGINVMRVEGTGEELLPSTTEADTMGDWQRKAPFVVRHFKPTGRKLKVRLFGPGTLAVHGAGIRTVVRRFKSGGLKSVPVRLDRDLGSQLKFQPKVKVMLQIRFEPRGALPNTLRKSITLRHK